MPQVKNRITIKGSEIDQLGQETVARKIAEAEGSDFEEVKARLERAKETYLKTREGLNAT